MEPNQVDIQLPHADVVQPGQATYKTEKIQKGFNWAVFLMALTTIAVIVATGYLAYNLITSSNLAIANDVPDAVEIVDKSDLDDTSAVLDKITFNNTDLTNLEEQLNNL